MLFINFAGKGTNKRVIIQIYTVFLSFLTVFIYSEQKASPVGGDTDYHKVLAFKFCGVGDFL